jgi:uncharacterized protein (TIGR03118 family)
MRRLSPSRLALFAAVLALAATTAATASAHGRDDNGTSGRDDRGGQQAGVGTYGYGSSGSGDSSSDNPGSGSYGGGANGADDQGGAKGDDDHHRGRHHDRAAGYTVTPLVADQAGAAPTVDPNLVNGWGISQGPTTPWWVANQGSNTSTLYTGAGAPQALVVKVAGGPTGTVFNPGTGFLVSNGTANVPARFIFATLAGTIQAWPTPPPAGTVTFPKVDNSATHAVYTGLAISPDASTLYAANFASGKVDTFDSTWAPATLQYGFSDPYLPHGYAPFGIQAIGNSIFVTYAKQPATPGPEVHGPGLGIVDEYSDAGQLLHRVGSFGGLNAPWGIAYAPDGFGKASGELLVGNFGDGRINTFARHGYDGRWQPAGQLRGTDHHPLAIDGLWGIGFGNGQASGPITSLYFAAGPQGGTHGLFGTVTAAAATYPHS